MKHTNDGVSDYIRACAAIGFGRVRPEGGVLVFYQALNGAMVQFLQGLPAPMRSEAMLFCMRYAGIRIGEEIDFFRNYYAPVWSVIYWITDGRVDKDLMRDGIAAHAMAMLLHSLDDHLADGELLVTHLTLLLRSQAWYLMQEALARFSGAVVGGPEAAENLIDDYYSAIGNSAAPDTIDEYCERFRKQMATGLIVPHIAALMAPGGSALAAFVRSAGESFGVAWRILDDIQDLGVDILHGRRTAIYCLLPEEGRVLWDSICSDTGICDANDAFRRLGIIMKNSGTIAAAVGLIREELGKASEFAREAGLAGLAGEYRTLMEPLALLISE